jgi:hypothetical protein
MISPGMINSDTLAYLWQELKSITKAKSAKLLEPCFHPQDSSSTFILHHQTIGPSTEILQHVCPDHMWKSTARRSRLCSFAEER